MSKQNSMGEPERKKAKLELSFRNISLEDGDLIELEIENFRNELLAKIFGYLDADSKKNCNLVCRKFWFVIQNTPALWKNMVYRFTNRTLHKDLPPYTCFVQSNHPFYNVEASYAALMTVQAPMDENLPNIAKEFWSKVGKETKILKICGTSNANELIKTLTHFPAIEELYIKEFDVLVNIYEMPQTIRNIHAEVFRSHLLETTINVLTHFETLQIMTATTFVMNENAEKVEFRVVSQDVKNLTPSCINIKLKNINLLTIQEVKLSHILIYLRLNRIDQLLTLTVPMSLLLKMIAGIEFMVFDKTNPCFFAHQMTSTMSHLEKVVLNCRITTKEMCKTCVDTFIRICPNIERFDGIGNSASTFHKIMKSINFKELTISTKFAANSGAFFTPMRGFQPNRFANLRVLKVSRMRVNVPQLWSLLPFIPGLLELELNSDYVSAAGIEMITLKYPQLQRFTYSASLTLDQMKSLVVAWPKLKYLALDFEGYFNGTITLVDFIREYCKELKVLGFCGGIFLQARHHNLMDKIEALFCNVETLRQIDLISFKSFYNTDFKTVH